MVPRLGLIDYGMGNLHSVQHAFQRLDRSLTIVRSPEDIYLCEALVLPGVGAFDPAMEQLRKTGLVPHLQDWANADRPFLGICLGLQLFFESSEEGQSDGLGILKGHVKRLPISQKERIPHMGWAPLQLTKECPLIDKSNEESWMYFVHSYSAIPLDSNNLAASTRFGQIDVTAIVWNGRVGACQFHPEKSGKHGQKMLEIWLNWLDKGALSLK